MKLTNINSKSAPKAIGGYTQAMLVGRGDELGTVEPGKLADLVLLDANPLEDFRHTQRIRSVVASGRLYRQSDLHRLLAEVEASVQQGRKQE